MLVAGGLLVGAAPIEAAPAAPDYYAVTIKTHSFNMCSTNFANCGSQGGVAARDLVHWFKNSDGPWTIALQEMCGADIQDLVNRTGMPGHMGVAKNPAASCPGLDKTYGNGVLRSGSLAASAIAFRFPTQEVLPCYPSQRECRIAVCAPMNSYAGVLNTCSAHLENTDRPDYGEPQANEYIYWVNAASQPGGKIMAGDFNLDPNQIPNVFYSQYWRAPQQNTFKANGLFEQIDYVWHDRAHSLNNLLRSPHCNIYYSDHCYVFSKFQ